MEFDRVSGCEGVIELEIYRGPIGFGYVDSKYRYPIVARLEVSLDGVIGLIELP